MATLFPLYSKAVPIRSRCSTCRRSGCCSGRRGWSKSSSALCDMPSLSMTRRDLAFAGTVKDTNSPRPNVAKPYPTTAFAPSVARPCPQYSAANLPDFHAGCKRRIKRRNAQTNETDEVSVSPMLNGAQAEPVLPKMRIDAIRNGVTLFSRKHVRHKFHDAEISAHASKQLAVGVPPLTENQALGADAGRRHSQRLNDLGSTVSQSLPSEPASGENSTIEKKLVAAAVAQPFLTRVDSAGFGDLPSRRRGEPSS